MSYPKPTPGTRFQHFKGNLYEFIASSTHSETLEEYVVYKALYGDYGIWVRPAELFFGSVLHHNESIPRFKVIEN